ncbi:7-carboxy-7-deazaguanine synthase QueE [bacterium]|nr:MAG: 7-carboxy-7-deazaguanine synthase QueE [bacterium]
MSIMLKGKITEVFESFQGEGLYLGERQIFVRFFGCNLSCKFCDTKPDRFTEYSPEELFARIKQHGNDFHSLAFTGGEPLLQKDFLKEIAILTRRQGFRHYLETNGTLPEELKEVIDLLDIIAMDLKLPSSTSLSELWEEHGRFLEIASRKEVFLKIVVCESTHEQDLHKAIALIKRTHQAVVLVLQPNSYEGINRLNKKLEDFKAISTDNSITTCIIPQVHKIAGLR